MKIVHVTQPTDGGTAAVVRDLVAAGLHLGHEVVVVSPATDGFPRWVEDAGATWRLLDLRRAPSPADLMNVLRLRRHVAGADVVHLHSSKAGVIGRVAARTLPTSRRPGIVFTPHGWSWYVGGRAATLYRFIERALSGAADVIVTVSELEQSDGMAVLGRRARLSVIENGVSTDRYNPVGERAPRTASPLVVHVGRHSRQKAQDRSIRALAALEDRRTVLRLIGGGDAAEARALTEQLGVADRVEIIGAADPRPHVRAADVVLLPSRWEGMPLALLEAMALGAAIVSTDTGGSDALGETGVLVANGEDSQVVAGIASALASLLGDEPRRQRLGMAARERAVSSYSLVETTDSYDRVWRDVARHVPRAEGRPSA